MACMARPRAASRPAQLGLLRLSPLRHRVRPLLARLHRHPQGHLLRLVRLHQLLLRHQ
jgi:hypothetical protein